MKKTIQCSILAAILSANTFILSAQPVITSVNMPVSGDSVIIGICSNPVIPGPSGAAQTWNMTTLTETSQGYFKFLPPAQTFWGYQFTNSNLCGKSWAGSYTYYNSGPTSFEQNGSCLLLDTVPPPNDTVKSVCSNAEELLNFPFSYPALFTDSFAGTNYAFGFSQQFNGDITVEADGYGTLILPNGTYNDVVRYHFIRNQYSSLSPPQVKEQWGWISEDHRFWLLLMETINDGFSTSSLVWYNKNPIITSASEEIAEHLTAIYPNPVGHGQQLFIKWNRSEDVFITIADVTGKEMYSGIVKMSAGNNGFTISDKVKAQGTYFMRIQNNDFVFNRKIILFMGNENN